QVGNYKRTVKRIDDGHRLCNDLMNCVHERAKIEKSYAQQLTDWSKRWRQLIEKGPQYGSLERAWGAIMTEADKVSELHQEVKNSLLNDDFEKVKNWQKDAYHKQIMGGFKEAKEAEDGFRKAQKPWAKKLKELETAKKAYHLACKEEKLAMTREANSKADQSNTPEQQKKLQDKVEKCKQDVQKTQEKYEKVLDELNKCTPQYMESMEQVFEQCQQFEEKRLNFLKEVLLDIKRHLNLAESSSYANVYRELEQTIRLSDAQEDLRWFRSTSGPGMPMNWPQFEVRLSPPRFGDPQPHSRALRAARFVPPGVEPGPDAHDNTQGEGTVGPSLLSHPANLTQHESHTPEDAPTTSSPFLPPPPGDELTKLGEEDEQGWCKGRLDNGQLGLYPANYVEAI
ncbi:PACN1 protein, partial [Odontophorus gujanensis]|nr:PACN1 protein [Odontophorus gujanensis]